MTDLPLPSPGTEALDARDLEPNVAEQTLREIAMTNMLLGGNWALASGLRALRRELPAGKAVSVLDVGAGDGRGTALARRILGVAPTRAVALDHHRTAARLCQERAVSPVLADMTRLPLAPGSIDVLVASLVLHHVTRSEAVTLVAALDAAARLGVVIMDLRRSSFAATGFGVIARACGFHPVTRHDGQVSIRRGFAAEELSRIIADAGVPNAKVRRRPGWRLVAHWSKADANG